MPHHDTQSPARAQKPGLDHRQIIDFRRRHQRRGARTLADGAVVAYLSHEDLAVRVSATRPGTRRSGVAIAEDVVLAVAASPSTLPGSYDACAALPWRTVGTIREGTRSPAFAWSEGVIPCFSDSGAVAAKGFAAYYHLYKGYELDPDDGIIANPAPPWAAPELDTT